MGFAPAPVAAKTVPNVFDLLGQSKPAAISATPAALTPQQPSGTPSFSAVPLQPTVARPNYGHSSSGSSSVLSPSTSSTPAGATAIVTGPKSSGNFDDLWNMSIGSNLSASKPSTSGAGVAAGKSIKDLEREKATAGMWGSTTSAGSSRPGAAGPMNDFGVTTTTSGGGFGNSGGDDLLL